MLLDPSLEVLESRANSIGIEAEKATDFLKPALWFPLELNRNAGTLTSIDSVIPGMMLLSSTQRNRIT